MVDGNPYNVKATERLISILHIEGTKPVDESVHISRGLKPSEIINLQDKRDAYVQRATILRTDLITYQDAGLKIQKVTRGHFHRNIARLKLVKLLCAIRIQSFYRGCKVRYTNNVKKKRAFKHKHAILIQKVYRGRLGRLYFKRYVYNNAYTIQRAWRHSHSAYTKMLDMIKKLQARFRGFITRRIITTPLLRHRVGTLTYKSISISI